MRPKNRRRHLLHFEAAVLLELLVTTCCSGCCGDKDFIRADTTQIPNATKRAHSNCHEHQHCVEGALLCSAHHVPHVLRYVQAPHITRPLMRCCAIYDSLPARRTAVV